MLFIIGGVVTSRDQARVGTLLVVTVLRSPAGAGAGAGRRGRGAVLIKHE